MSRSELKSPNLVGGLCRDDVPARSSRSAEPHDKGRADHGWSVNYSTLTPVILERLTECDPAAEPRG